MPKTITRRTLSLLIALTFLATATGTKTMAEDMTSTPPVTLINAFEVSEDQIEDTIRFWEKAQDFLKDQPGYISTRLHRSLAPNARFQLINVAQWQSPETFQAAIAEMRKSDVGSGMHGTVFHAALYQVIRTDEGPQ